MGLGKKFASMFGTSKNSDLELNQEKIVISPMNGKIIPLDQINDPVFSSGALGNGIAIEPEEGKVYAPIDGKVETFFPTGHAVGIAGKNGVEVLIHIGMDTVNMNGKGFLAKVKEGDTVKKGDLILEFDIDEIKKAGYSTNSPIIVTNTDSFEEVLPKSEIKIVSVGEEIIVCK